MPYPHRTLRSVFNLLAASFAMSKLQIVGQHPSPTLVNHRKRIKFANMLSCELMFVEPRSHLKN